MSHRWYRLQVNKGYVFKVRHSASDSDPSGDGGAEWGEFSSESEPVHTTIQREINKPRAKQRRPKVSISFLAIRTAIVATFERFTHSVLLSTMILSVLIVWNFRAVIVRLLDAVLGTSKAGAFRVYLLVCVLSAVLVSFGKSFPKSFQDSPYHKVASWLAETILTCSCLAVATLTGVVALHLLWWHSVRLSWPLVSNGTSFLSVISFLTGVQIHLTTQLAERWLRQTRFGYATSWSWTISLVNFMVWLEMVFMLIVLVWVVEQLLDSGKKNSKHVNPKAMWRTVLWRK
mmetsp:Transcript_23248/g.37004  ORF Transcript_23248/g.37004 Transcript_23248/m.37004 type:complete len:288 (-) Transcript_23248:32-895(-)